MLTSSTVGYCAERVCASFILLRLQPTINVISRFFFWKQQRGFFAESVVYTKQINLKKREQTKGRVCVSYLHVVQWVKKSRVQNGVVVRVATTGPNLRIGSLGIFYKYYYCH